MCLLHTQSRVGGGSGWERANIKSDGLKEEKESTKGSLIAVVNPNRGNETKQRATRSKIRGLIALADAFGLGLRVMTFLASCFFDNGPKRLAASDVFLACNFR